MIKQKQERIEAQKKYDAERRNQARNGIQSKGKGVAMSDCKCLARLMDDVLISVIV